MILIFGLFDSTIVIKTKDTEQKILVGRETAEAGFYIRTSESALLVRFAGNVWNMTPIKTGWDMHSHFSPDLSGPSPRLIDEIETSNMSFVAKFKNIDNVTIEKRNYKILDVV